MIKPFVPVTKSNVSDEKLERMKSKGIQYYSNGYVDLVQNIVKEDEPKQRFTREQISEIKFRIINDLGLVIDKISEIGQWPHNKDTDRQAEKIEEIISHELGQYDQFIWEVVHMNKSVDY